MSVHRESGWLVALMLGAAAACQTAPAPSAPARVAGPSCEGFSGMIHGTSACREVVLSTGAVVTSTQRVMPDDTPLAKLECGASGEVGGHRLTVSCVKADEPRSVTVSVSVDGRSPVALHSFDRFYDFIAVWSTVRGGSLAFTIDYGVLD